MSGWVYAGGGCSWGRGAAGLEPFAAFFFENAFGAVGSAAVAVAVPTVLTLALRLWEGSIGWEKGDVGISAVEKGHRGEERRIGSGRGATGCE